MVKSFLVVYFVLCWCVLQCFCDDPPAPGSDEAREKANKALGIECHSMSTTVTEDAEYLQKNILSKNATVTVEKDFFIVAYQSAAVVSRPANDKQTTTTHAHLKEGVDAIMSRCKPDDGKIDGAYSPKKFKDTKEYRICLTGSEETDDC